ncbi:hypothetical protein VNO77_05060 [Canavalia gladiata]|uniref:Transmembrane protein n=1 Tax=Canavalia gladiata TaxID=3824 RepID=A0AAN9MXN2_CANGL
MRQNKRQNAKCKIAFEAKKENSETFPRNFPNSVLFQPFPAPFSFFSFSFSLFFFVATSTACLAAEKTNEK